jgi:DNA-directed RNA polymerase specialized sigma24 family protein
MTKQKLKQLTDLRAEIKDTERRIELLRSQEAHTARDRVRASGREWPYIEGHATVTGRDEKDESKKIRSLRWQMEALEKKKAKAEELKAELEEYICGIDDSRVRRMIEYRYIDGYTSEKVGRLMHCDRSTVERTIDRYLKEQP